jgi:hypothetical protein
MKQVIKNTKSAAVDCIIGKKQAIGNPILQYQARGSVDINEIPEKLKYEEPYANLISAVSDKDNEVTIIGNYKKKFWY